MACTICWNETVLSKIVCAEGHVTCETCLELYVIDKADTLGKTDFLAAQAETAAAERNEVRRAQLNGACFCPLHGHGCEARPFEDRSLALHTTDETFGKYIQAKTLLPAARKVKDVIEKKQELSMMIPNARQCGRCAYGPVELYRCDDLAAHHGQVGDGDGARPIDNSCPRCGWFARHISQWPPWDPTAAALGSDDLEQAVFARQPEEEAQARAAREQAARRFREEHRPRRPFPTPLLRQMLALRRGGEEEEMERMHPRERMRALVVLEEMEEVELERWRARRVHRATLEQDLAGAERRRVEAEGERMHPRERMRALVGFEEMEEVEELELERWRARREHRATLEQDLAGAERRRVEAEERRVLVQQRRAEAQRRRLDPPVAPEPEADSAIPEPEVRRLNRELLAARSSDTPQEERQSAMELFAKLTGFAVDSGAANMYLGGAEWNVEAAVRAAVQGISTRWTAGTVETANEC